MWYCECDCGNNTVVRGSRLKEKKVRSCGCLARNNAVKHGMSYHPLYCIWYSMVRRCDNSKDNGYKYYGGRGITVCDRWHDLKSFINDMEDSYKPGLSIERVDNNGNYELSNCKWATMKEQANNKRNTIR